MKKENNQISLENNLIQNENFIIFGADFARHPHALEHVLRPLFNSNRFLWVDTVGLRSPEFSFYDLKRVIEKVSKWFKKDTIKFPSPKESLVNVQVIAPFMIPYNQFMLVRKFNKWSVEKKVRKFLLDNQMNNPILITCLPSICDIAGSFNERLKIYYCVDELSLWPGLNKNLIIKLEKKLMENVDLIIATSEYLSKTKKIIGKETPVITHGVDFNHFNIGEIHSKNEKLKICYFGLFDERNDQEILKNIAINIPHCEIHIFGSIVCDTRKLSVIPNIIFHGKINYADLPYAIKEMDIFILPYIRNQLSDNINPLKLKEYLSTGRPVIATDLPEIVKLEEYLLIAKNSEGFVSTIENLRNKKILHNTEIILQYIKENETWLAKSQILSEIIIKNV